MGPPRRHALDRLADERGELEAMRGVGEAPLHEQEAPHNMEFFTLVADVKGVLSRLEAKVHGKGGDGKSLAELFGNRKIAVIDPVARRGVHGHGEWAVRGHLWMRRAGQRRRKLRISPLTGDDGVGRAAAPPADPPHRPRTRRTAMSAPQRAAPGLHLTTPRRHHASPTPRLTAPRRPRLAGSAPGRPRSSK